MRSMKKLFIILLTLLFISPTVAFAQSPTPKVATQSAKFNSFEAFWPLVAGKTQEDSLYFLKTWKENLRGFLIFGSAQKAEYEVFLATKRVLEAESLISKNSETAANETVNRALSLLDQSLANLEKSGQDKSIVAVEIKNRLDNLIILVDKLRESKEGSLKENLDNLHSKIEKNLEKIKN